MVFGLGQTQETQDYLSTICLVPRYKDNPFSLGDAFGSRWETDSSWGVDKGEEEAAVTISSIRPIGER